MYGESTYTGIDIDSSVEVHWIFVSIKEHEQADNSIYKIELCSESISYG